MERRERKKERKVKEREGERKWKQRKGWEGKKRKGEGMEIRGRKETGGKE